MLEFRATEGKPQRGNDDLGVFFLRAVDCGLLFNRVRHGRSPETQIAAGASTWPPRDLIGSATTEKQHGTILRAV